MGINISRSIAILVLALPLGAQLVEDNRVVTKRFPIGSGAEAEIAVAIVTGHIKVTAHAGQEVVMNVKIHYEAPDAAGLAELQKRVRLESEQSGANVWIGIEGEGWNGGSRGGSGRLRELGWRRNRPAATPPQESGRRWRFRHDVELLVPRTAHLKLSTVNGGDIQVDGVTGEFHLNNVNGGIEAKNVEGFGRAHTVNGPVTLGFRKNPAGPTSVKTVNGKVSVSLPPAPHADFKLKTFNGRIYSDFAMAAGVAASPATSSENGMKRIWRSNSFSQTRVGNGGPEIQIDGLNTDIHILESKN